MTNHCQQWFQSANLRLAFNHSSLDFPLHMSISLCLSIYIPIYTYILYCMHFRYLIM